jgi:hypothetical protein
MEVHFINFYLVTAILFMSSFAGNFNILGLILLIFRAVNITLFNKINNLLGKDVLTTVCSFCKTKIYSFVVGTCVFITKPKISLHLLNNSPYAVVMLNSFQHLKFQ